jgi:hypothetical protein
MKKYPLGTSIKPYLAEGWSGADGHSEPPDHAADLTVDVLSGDPDHADFGKQGIWSPKPEFH